MALAVCLVACQEDAATQDDALEPDATSGDSGEGETEGAPIDETAGDLCAQARLLSPGTTPGTLRSKSSSGGGACGNAGPDAFFVLDVPRRSDVGLTAIGRDYEPIVGVLPTSCVLQWDDRALACARGVQAWVTDVAAGTRLIVAVGIDPDDPALQTFEVDGVDPLDFELKVELREIFGEGDACGPDRSGRCEGGTACLPLQIEESDDTQLTCQRLQADTCDAAQPLLIDEPSGEVVIPADAIHTDAHVHGCTGDRAPERVLAATVALNVPPEGALEFSATGASGLAVRDASCAPSAELACDDAGQASQAAVSLARDDVPADRSILVFVELPPLSASEGDASGGGEEAPITLRWELVDTR